MDNIDERVAIKVMGWHERLVDHWGEPPAFWWCNERDIPVFKTVSWQPSKRIEQAWMIFEQLEGDWQLNAVGGKYMLWQEKTLGPWADTVPMAICLAALEAKG